MINVHHDKDYIYVEIHSSFFRHDYRIHAPISETEAKELAHALQTELQEIDSERKPRTVASSCICVPGLPVMAVCPVHDAGPYPGAAVTAGGSTFAKVDPELRQRPVAFDPKDIPPLRRDNMHCTCRKRWETWRKHHQRYCVIATPAELTSTGEEVKEEPVYSVYCVHCTLPLTNATENPCHACGGKDPAHIPEKLK